MKLEKSLNPGETKIDNAIIEKHLALAPSEYVKIYVIALCMFQNSQNHLQLINIARVLDASILSILEAFKFWEEKKLVDILEDGDCGKIEIVFRDIKDINDNNDLESCGSEQSEDLFLEFVKRLEFKRNGKVLSPEAIRRLAYYKNNLGLSIELIEFACNLSYDNVNVKEHNHLNYARGILNNLYESNIFTLEEYYKRKQQSNYNIPSFEDVQKQMDNNSGQSGSGKNSYKSSRNFSKKPKPTSIESNLQDQSHIDRITANIDSYRQKMREKMQKNKS